MESCSKVVFLEVASSGADPPCSGRKVSFVCSKRSRLHLVDAEELALENGGACRGIAGDDHEDMGGGRRGQARRVEERIGTRNQRYGGGGSGGGAVWRGDLGERQC
jgi:hypothetical protein